MENIINYFTQNWIELIGMCLGILYLYYEYRAHIFVWLIGVLMPIFYIIVYWDSHLYALMAINIYYIIICIYGWYKWARIRKETIPQSNRVSSIPNNDYWIYIGIALFIVFAMVYFLLSFLDGEQNLAESAVTALSIVATWMLTKKWIELWILLSLANLLSLYIYINSELWLTFILHIIYLVGSIMGYINWKRSLKLI